MKEKLRGAGAKVVRGPGSWTQKAVVDIKLKGAGQGDVDEDAGGGDPLKGAGQVDGDADVLAGGGDPPSSREQDKS